MFSKLNQRIFIVPLLMGALLFGAAAAEARGYRDTKGADRLVKGAIIGAVVGGVTQTVRGRTRGGELLKGAAVGGAVGAAVGAYSDYRQERNAREDEAYRSDRYRYRDSRPSYGYDRYDDRSYYQNDNRARRSNGHRHNANCRRR
jgi:hypothetical protein